MAELDPLKQQEQMAGSNPQKNRKKSRWATIGCSFAGVIAAFGILGIILFFSFVGRCTKVFSDGMIIVTKLAESMRDLSNLGNYEEDVDPEYALGKELFDEEKYDEAITWFLKASERGVADATYHLGLCFRDGLGVDKDADRSMEYFRLAAEQGSDEAQAEVAKHDIKEGVEEAKEDVEEFAKEQTESVKSYIPKVEEKAKDIGLDIDLSGIF